ncbi:MAG: GPW/gp25 family protein [Deltaproteobacteria bacterium]|nr:GPW/gp25 family protein [Deltaproteobacteria bacterium]
MKNFLGNGFAFPLRVDGRGQVESAAGEKSIAEAIRLILGTAIGERVMRPDFGCAIHDLVFHPLNANTCSEISLHVNQALTKWEPRIENLKVRSYPDPSSENTVLILIEYRVRSTNNLLNLVYPFYLRREQDL